VLRDWYSKNKVISLEGRTEVGKKTGKREGVADPVGARLFVREEPLGFSDLSWSVGSRWGGTRKKSLVDGETKADALQKTDCVSRLPTTC